MLKNVDSTHLVLANGKLVLQNKKVFFLFQGHNYFSLNILDILRIELGA